MKKDIMKRAEEFFAKDRFAANTNIKIEEIKDEYCLCSMKLEDVHKNANNGIQGGAIFTLADLAFAVSANAERLYDKDKDFSPTISQSASISFLKGTKGKKLYAKSVCLSKGRHVCVYSISVYDDLGVDIAQVIVNGFTKIV